MKRLAGFLVAAVCIAGVCPGQASSGAFTYQGRLHFQGDPAEGQHDFDFLLFDSLEGGIALGSVTVRRISVDKGYFTALLNFEASVLDGSDLWLEICVKPSKGILKTTLEPRQRIQHVPYATYATKAATASSAESLSGTVDVSQVSGLLGKGILLHFPDVLYNRARLEIEPALIIEKAWVVSPLGYQIDRIVTYDAYGQIVDLPGFSMEYPLVVELEHGTDSDTVRAYFDNYYAGDSILTMGLTVHNLSGEERFRWHLFDFAPYDYESSFDGRTRFTFVHNRPPDNALMLWFHGPDFGNERSYNPLTDSGVEIEGIGIYAPEVEVDAAERTVTMTFSFNEGAGIYDWVARTIQQGLAGAPDGPNMSVIKYDGGQTEISRKNYFRCFPIRYEILDGFGLDVKVRHRVVITYAWAEAG